MLDLCVSLVKDAIELVIKSKQIRNDTKLRISVLLEEISKILNDTATKLEKDEYPHFNCSLMEKLSDHLHFHLTNTLPKKQLDELEQVLREASQVERQFATRKDSGTIPSIINASAEFKSLSLLMKI